MAPGKLQGLEKRQGAAETRISEATFLRGDHGQDMPKRAIEVLVIYCCNPPRHSARPTSCFSLAAGEQRILLPCTDSMLSTKFRRSFAFPVSSSRSILRWNAAHMPP